MGTQEAPQDLHGQDTGRGPPERNRQMEANVCGLRGLGLGRLSPATIRQLGCIRSPVLV